MCADLVGICTFNKIMLVGFPQLLWIFSTHPRGYAEDLLVSQVLETKGLPSIVGDTVAPCIQLKVFFSWISALNANGAN